MKVRRGLSKKSARFTALMLAVALVLSNVGAGMQTSYADEPLTGQTAGETEETEPKIEETDQGGGNVTEENTAEPKEEVSSDTPTETTEGTTAGPEETLLGADPEAAGEGTTDGAEEPSAPTATPSDAVEVTVVVASDDGIADTDPEAGTHAVSTGESFTLTVTPNKYYRVSAVVTPEEVACQETQAKDGTYTYTLSNLQKENTVTVTAEYLEAVAAYYAVVEEVEAFGDVTVNNIEEAVTLYKKLTPAQQNAHAELGTNTTALDTNYTNVRTSFAEKIKAVWKGDQDDGWYLILTHEAQGDETFTPIKEYIYLSKSDEYLAEYEKYQSETDASKKTAKPNDTLKKDDPRLIALQRTFEGKVYSGNSIDDIGRDLPGAGGEEFTRPVEVTFYYTDASGDGWSFDPATGTLTLTGDVTTIGADHPWAAFANEITKICTSGEKRISICDNAFSSIPYKSTVKIVELTNVLSIGDNAFANCTALNEVALKNVGKIGCGAFHHCTCLAVASLEDVEQIGDFAEDSSEDVSVGAFYQCTNLGNGDFDGYKDSAGNLIPGKLTLKNVKTIGANSFSTIGNLTNLEMSGVERIGTQAFYNSLLRLGNIQIPDSCKFIGANAFSMAKGRKTSVVIDIPENSDLTLAYSNVFSKMPKLIDRMKSLWNHSFQLSPITTSELSVPEGWINKAGDQNSTEPGQTQITKSARWADDAKTKAEIELQFSHSTTPGKDILFLLDYSRSIAYPANYKDSKLYNIQFKTIDLIEDLFDKGYDNRVGIITFGGPAEPTIYDEGHKGSVDEVTFTKDESGLIEFVSTGSSYIECTSYTRAFDKAKEMIENRDDSSREVEIIFISDGVPMINNTPLPYEGDIKTAVDAVKAIPNVEIFSVLQADKSTALAEETMMRQIASAPEYYFRAEDTGSFNDAVNAAIAAAYGTFTVTDTVGADFDLDAASVVARSYNADGEATVLSGELSSVSFSKDADGNDVITWKLPALANTLYTLTFTENLKPDAAGKYLSGELDTNTGDAEVWAFGENEAANAVATPKLSRDSYGITVHYLEKDTNETLAEDGKYTGSENEAYDISDLLNQQIEGYQIDSYQTVEGQTPQAQGTLTENIEINVYYVRTPEPTNPEPTEPEPTNPNPPSGGGSTGGTTPSPTPGPGPGSTTEIQDNETPLGPAPIQIEDAAVPLADGALIVIDDEDVPLSGAPETGDNRPIGAAALMAVLAIGMMGVFGSLGFRKKDTE